MPLPDNKNPSSPSVFLPTALLREARRQKLLATVDVPAVCILDPDGDIVRRLRQTGQAQRFEMAQSIVIQRRYLPPALDDLWKALEFLIKNSGL